VRGRDDFFLKLFSNCYYFQFFLSNFILLDLLYEKRQLDPSLYFANAVKQVAMMKFAKKSCNGE
jgi:hypothetical protein